MTDYTMHLMTRWRLSTITDANGRPVWKHLRPTRWQMLRIHFRLFVAQLDWVTVIVLTLSLMYAALLLAPHLHRTFP